MDFAWLVKIVAALILVAVIAFIFASIVTKAIFDKDLSDLFQSKQRIIIGWSADINSDRTVKLSWETKEKEIDFVVYEMYETKAESEPSEPKYELSSIKPKNDKEKWAWTSSKLEAGSHFFVIVPVKDGEEISEESSKEINANFYDDEYIDIEGKCEGKRGKDAEKCRTEFAQKLIDMGFAQI